MPSSRVRPRAGGVALDPWRPEELLAALSEVELDRVAWRGGTLTEGGVSLAWAAGASIRPISRGARTARILWPYTARLAGVPGLLIEPLGLAQRLDVDQILIPPRCALEHDQIVAARNEEREPLLADVDRQSRFP